jgi:soluble lytic murein transglycosylase-like protein
MIWRRTLLSAAFTVAIASPAAAELVFFASGRTLSVRTYRVENNQAILELRGGGQITCDVALVVRVAADEVPYPEPVELSAAVTPLPPARMSVQYARLIEDASVRHQVDPRLVHAVIQVESRYQPSARSPKGAMGLMQLMPGTARQYAVTNPYDPAQNVNAGVRHLRSLLDRFDVRLALAAYNAGEEAVLRFGGIPPYRETRDYVKRVLALAGPFAVNH